MILDWNDAYANAPHIPEGAEYPARFASAADSFRGHLSRDAAEYDIAYGPDPRHRFDLFHPEGESHGLAVFVHGGFWQAFDKSAWSHLAAGARARGWTVALPSYRLAPQVTIPGITQDVAAAITAAAARINGPICLAGHSAGGHLVSRMTSHTTPLTADVTSRLRHVLSISGLHDLRPLMNTAMNRNLALTETTAAEESPALLRPLPKTRLTAWVGAAERPEFCRQNALLPNIWRGLGPDTREISTAGLHHFNICDGLCDPAHPMAAAFVGEDHWGD